MREVEVKLLIRLKSFFPRILKLCSLYSYLYPVVAELSDIDADSSKEAEVAPEAAAVEMATQRARPKKKARSKKELTGEKFLPILPIVNQTVCLTSLEIW